MKIATWNVNSVRKRTGNLVSWLQRAKPDVVVLQEIKAQEAQFPTLEVEAAGYKVDADMQAERDALIGRENAGLWLEDGSTNWNHNPSLAL